MKSFIVIATLLASISTFAGELEVLKVSARKAKGALSTRFDVNLENGTAGVVLTATRHITIGRSSRWDTKTFEKAVPELSLVGDTLVFSSNGETVDCGTMGVTRVFKRPVLILSGKCDLITKRNGSDVSVILVTE